MKNLDRLFRPRHMAIFGGSWAREVIRQSRMMGFAGEIWPVHPDKEEVEGLPAFPSIAALPEAPDASFIGVNRHASIEVLRELSARGAGGAVCFASGFREVGPEGDALQAELVAAAGDMLFLGPNCYGFINALDGALLWPDLHGCKPVERGVAFVMQSSNMAINLSFARRALPIAYVVCLGNQAQTGMAGVITSLTHDPRVSVICLHIEGLDDPTLFAEAVLEARKAGKPVIALKAGQSEQAHAVTFSHTASLAGAAAVSAAYLERLGVGQVDTLTELLETAKFLHVNGPIGSGGLVTMSCSGGEAALLADAADRAGVHMPPFDAASQARIKPTVHTLVALANPFDYHTFDWGVPDRLEATFTAVMAGPQAVTTLVIDVPPMDGDPRMSGWDQALDAYAKARETTGASCAMMVTVPENLTLERARALAEQGVAPMMGIGEMMTAIRIAAELGQTIPSPPVLHHEHNHGPKRLLSEAEGKALLAQYGVPVPEGGIAHTVEQAESLAEKLGWVAMKAVGADLSHKTEQGAVVLNVTEEHAAETFERLIPLGDAVLVERMVEHPVAELLVGAARDPALGLHMVIGAGGTLTELLRDSVILFPPVSAEALAKAVDGLRIAPMLDGWRGTPGADRDAMIQALLAIQDFILAERHRLVELDINPLILTPDGAMAADALIRLEENSS